MVDGVEWHQVNHAKRAEILIQLSSMRSGELRFMLIDNSEHLDDETWSGIEEGAKAAGFQIIAAEMIRRQPLKVETT